MTLQDLDESSSQPNTSSDDNDVVDSPQSPNCIYIDSVDSGRSSDTGTHQSWSSSSGSSTKSRSEKGKKSAAEKIQKEVQIVPHNFCDYLGSIKRRISPTSTASSSYASMSSCQKNKVRVYVPYSTLIALTNEIRETPVDDVDEPLSTEDPSSDLNNENVLICDTQVILRINPDQDLPKRSNKRMTKRLLNESEAFSVVQEEVSPNSIDASKLISKGKLLPKRKDLCKLLGLNEQDVDLMIVPEVKVAQKVALNHLDTTVNQDSILNTNQQQPKNTAKKKDLAKFLGVEEVENDISKLKSDSNATAIQASSLSSSSTKGKAESQTHSKRSSLLINWGQMVKSSVKGWKLEEDNEMEMDVPVQLRQIPAREPNRQHRKDLSKFLGFDDSDSEEIVFIRNHANPSINDSSLTRKSSSFEDDQDDQDDSDDSVGSLRSFDSFVRRSLRCGASSEFAIQIEEGVMQQNNQQSRPITRGETVPHQNPPIRPRFKPHYNSTQESSNVAEERMMQPCLSKSLVTLDRPKHNPKSSQLQKKEGKPSRSVVFGPNSRRMISPVRNKPSSKSCKLQIPPVFLREEPLIVYPQKPALFYQHYPLYANYGILPPGGRINPSNGRVRVPRSTSKRPSMSS